MKQTKTKPSKPASAAEQHRRFIETARQLECDEDKERFEEKLGKIAKAKPKPSPQNTRGAGNGSKKHR